MPYLTFIFLLDFMLLKQAIRLPIMIKSLDQSEIRPTFQTVESLGESESEIPVNAKGG